ncbi:MAG: ribonuclease J [Ruminococcus sp.]|nr:ribonuclease J [Ruminococcus sp.]
MSKNEYKPVPFKENNKTSRQTKKEQRRTPVRIIPLGGLNEIGKNMTIIEYCNDMFIIDCGLAFPDTEMLGVDIVLPDFTYVEQNKSKLRAIILTHGHEDHIGGLAYLLKKVNAPIYGTKLTLALVDSKLKEHGISEKANLNIIEPKKNVKAGCMTIEFINVNHSIPDSIGMAIHTPAGVLVHTGDFKVDYTPINGGIIDLARFGELGSKGVLALMSDSTNAERPGFTATERKIGDSFDKLFNQAEGKRIIIATFSSNIHRIQQIINSAIKHNRKIALFGRSMVNVVMTAVELGYLKAPEDLIIDIELMNEYLPEQIVLITTGSQGEPMSALTRMAMNDHNKINISTQDFIIISATPIPGNEKYITKVINELMKSGAEVISAGMYEVHVSGHACQEELKLMLALTKPKFFIPVHGEYKHLKCHKQLAIGMGIPEENIILGEIGNVIETDGIEMKVVSQVTAGRVLVDGLGVGDIGSIVLRDRKHLSQDGLIIISIVMDRVNKRVVSGPDIISRGFVYVRESGALIDDARHVVINTLKHCTPQELNEWNYLKTKLRDVLSDYIYTKTKRNPMILPILNEI